MPEHKKKLEVFTESILNEAQSQSRRILDELHQSRDEAVSRAEAEISEQAAQYQAAAIAENAAREGRRVNSRLTENKHRLLEYREACAGEVFEAVSRRLAEFAASPEYPDYLRSLLDKAVGALGYGFSAEVYLRPEDMGLKDLLLNTVHGASLSFREGSFTLGGLQLVCQSMGRRVDASFDSSLEDMVGHFSEFTGIQMED